MDTYGTEFKGKARYEDRLRIPITHMAKVIGLYKSSTLLVKFQKYKNKYSIL